MFWNNPMRALRDNQQQQQQQQQQMFATAWIDLNQCGATTRPLRVHGWLSI
jgi:hypothetical protein